MQGSNAKTVTDTQIALESILPTAEGERIAECADSLEWAAWMTLVDTIKTEPGFGPCYQATLIHHSSSSEVAFFLRRTTFFFAGFICLVW